MPNAWPRSRHGAVTTASGSSATRIYHGLTYGERAPTALEHDPEAIVINSFSKYFSMTGWRLGWLVMPAALTEALTRIGQNVTISAPTLSQLGAEAAFDCHDECEAYVARYAVNRDIVLDGLREAGFDDLAPGRRRVLRVGGHRRADRAGPHDRQPGAVCRVAGRARDRGHPGVDFDPGRGHRYVRFSFAGSTEDCAEAMNRLKDWMHD